MKFRPLQDRVLIRRIEAEAKTAGGIIIPDTAQEKPMEGEVVAVGPGARGEDGTLHPLDVKPGDRVLFGKWSGTEIKLDGEDLIIVKESDIMGVLEGRPAKKKRRKGTEIETWLPKMSNFMATRATACCAASTFSPMPSR
jgi:chaperonin GroES